MKHGLGLGKVVDVTGDKPKGNKISSLFVWHREAFKVAGVTVSFCSTIS